MKILIISDSYPPDVRSAAELMYGLATAFQKRGHDVSVVTSSRESGAREEDGVKVIRVKTLPHHDVPFVLKGFSWLLMPRFFWRALTTSQVVYDAVIVHSPPLPLAWVAEQVKKKYGAKYILNVQDIFPQNAIDLGALKNKFLIKFFEKMEHRAYTKCDRVVTPSHEHGSYLMEKRGVPEGKIRVIPHWVDMVPFAEAKDAGAFRKKFGLENKFIVFFGGVIGPSQGLDIVIRLGKKIEKAYPDIAFLICGDGSEKKRLMEEAKEKGITNVRLENWVAKNEYPSLLKEMDVGLITLTAKNTTPAVPAKLLGYMAAGIPALGFLHEKSEAHQIIKEAECGMTALYENEDACLQALIVLYNNKAHLKEFGEKGLEYAKKNFSVESSVEKWEVALEDIGYPRY